MDVSRVQWVQWVQWTDMSESWRSPIVRSTELEGPLEHVVQSPDFMETEGPERLRNLPKLTQAGGHRPVPDPERGGCLRRPSMLARELGKLVTML